MLQHIRSKLRELAELISLYWSLAWFNMNLNSSFGRGLVTFCIALFVYFINSLHVRHTKYKPAKLCRNLSFSPAQRRWNFFWLSGEEHVVVFLIWQVGSAYTDVRELTGLSDKLETTSQRLFSWSILLNSSPSKYMTIDYIFFYS